MRALLVLASLLLLAPVVDAKPRPARWEKARVPVWDYTSEFWRPSVERTVAAYNAIIPKGGPVLVYTPMGELPCEALPGTGKKGGISVCSTTPDAGWTTYRRQRGTIVAALVALPGQTANISGPDGLVCHEFAHAVLYANDDFDLPHRDTSCVQGMRDAPGAWESALAHRLYGNRPKGTHRHR